MAPPSASSFKLASVEMEETTLDTFPMRNMANMDPAKSAGEIGKRLIPQIIDAYAQHEPDRIWGTQARSDDISQGFDDITFKQLAHCVNYLAWLIHEKVGPSSSFEAISYIGSADLRYCMMAWAAVKCGYQVRQSQLHLAWPSAYQIPSDSATSYTKLGIWQFISVIRPRLHEVLLLFRLPTAGREITAN